MVYDSMGLVTVMFGGGYATDTWEWDGTCWSEAMPAMSPAARDHHRMAYDADAGLTILFGEQSSGGTPFADTWSWNGTSWQQLAPASSPSARIGHAMGFDESLGLVVLFGGSGSSTFQDTWTWDGSTWSLVSATALCASATRRFAGMAYRPNQGLVMHGGQDGTGCATSCVEAVSNETWFFGE